MSSQTSRRPTFRLSLGYPILTITADFRGTPGDRPADAAIDRAGISAPTEIDLSKPGFGDQLRALGVAVRRARGVLRVVLREGEVWRGLVAGADPAEVARGEAAKALDLAPAALVLVSADPVATGETPFAAAPRAVLGEARGFLRRHGMRPASFSADGDFPGFPARPQFPAGVTPGLAALARRARALRPALPGVADLLPGWPPSGAFVACGGLGLACATVALVAAMGTRGGETLGAAPLVVASAETVTVTAPAAQVLTPRPPSAPASVAEPRAPVARVAAEPRPRRAERDLRIAMSAPAPLRSEALGGPGAPQPIVTMGTRDMPELAGVRVDRDLTAIRVAQLVGGPPSRSEMTALPPKRRPGAPDAAVVTLDPSGAIRRPEPRPGSAHSVADALALSNVDQLRPRPRLGTDRSKPLSPAITAAVGAAVKADPVRVASLSGAVPGTSALAAAGLWVPEPPEPRPDPPRAAVAPKPVAIAPTVVRAIVPTVVRAAAPVRVAPVPTARLAVAPQQVRATPEGSITRPAAQQRRVAIAAPVATQPRRDLGAAGANRAVEKSGIARGSLSLLGVFGTSTSRHALIRLPNGSVQRVRVGDTVAGAQVAAVSSDSVRLTGSGRDMVLRID